MKKCIIFILLLTMSVSSFSQQTNPTHTYPKTEYLKKSKTQKTVARILLGVGTALVITGGVLAATHNDVAWGFSEAAGYVVIIGGPGCLFAIASIPFFTASAKNKKRSVSLAFKNETAPQIQRSSFTYKSIPSLTLKINL